MTMLNKDTLASSYWNILSRIKVLDRQTSSEPCMYRSKNDSSYNFLSWTIKTVILGLSLTQIHTLSNHSTNQPFTCWQWQQAIMMENNVTDDSECTVFSNANSRHDGKENNYVNRTRGFSVRNKAPHTRAYLWDHTAVLVGHSAVTFHRRRTGDCIRWYKCWVSKRLDKQSVSLTPCYDWGHWSGQQQTNKSTGNQYLAFCNHCIQYNNPLEAIITHVC